MSRTIDRRQLLGAASATVASLACTPASLSAHSVDPNDPKKAFRYCMNTSTIRGAEHVDRRCDFPGC